MENDVIIDESKLPQIHEVKTKGKIKVWFSMQLSRWQKLPPETKKRRVIFAIVLSAAVIVMTAGVIVYSISDNNDNPPSDNVLNDQVNNVDIAEPEEPADRVSPLTGVLVTKSALEEIEKRRVLAVVVENHQDARPQSGLDKADIVFETLVEGGITRFVPLYLSQQPEVVGPVRSLRKYFLDFVAGFGDPVIMHIGYADTSDPQTDALGEVRRTAVKTLGFSTGTFWRVSDKLAPHNAYSSTKSLWELAEKEGWSGYVPTGNWTFKDVPSEIDEVTVSEVLVNWLGKSSLWSTRWKFDSVDNVYYRSHQDEPHIDAVTKKQLSARNVILLYTDQIPANDGANRIIVNTIGSGRSKVFIDGTVIDGTWEKTSRTEQFQVRDENGNAVVFNRGQSWIMVIPQDAEVIY